MKSKTVLIFTAAVLVAFIPATGLAQHAGFQIGVAQPQFGPATPQAPAIVTRSRFTGVPTVIIPPPPVVAPVPLVPTFPTVIVRNQILVPGQTVFQAPVGSPSAGGFIPSNTAQPVAPFNSGRHMLPAGTARADVIQQLGQPSVTVVTSTGETLYFSGGVTVIIQNGRVAGAR